jgi:hypothetical protein
MFDNTLTDHFQYQSHFVDTDNITLPDQRKNVQFINKKAYIQTKICLHCSFLYQPKFWQAYLQIQMYVSCHS